MDRWWWRSVMDRWWWQIDAYNRDKYRWMQKWSNDDNEHSDDDDRWNGN